MEAADTTSTTPLHRACSACKEMMVEVLIEAGASLVAADVNGDTAFHVAGAKALLFMHTPATQYSAELSELVAGLQFS